MWNNSNFDKQKEFDIELFQKSNPDFLKMKDEKNQTKIQERRMELEEALRKKYNPAVNSPANSRHFIPLNPSADEGSTKTPGRLNLDQAKNLLGDNFGNK